MTLMGRCAAGRDQEPIVKFDWTQDESVAAAIVRVVATVTGDGPMEMEPLYSVVDPGSFDALFDSIGGRHDRTDAVVEFPYNGVLVQVSATGNGYVFPRS